MTQTTEHFDPDGEAVPSISASIVAVYALAACASLVIALAGGLLKDLPIVLAVTFVVATIFGLPLLSLVRRAQRHRAWAVAVGGFATGVALPILPFLKPYADQTSVGGVPTVVDGAYTLAGVMQILENALPFGCAGVVGALAAWRLALWLSPGATGHHRTRRFMVAGAILCASAASIAVPGGYQDRSCHNPLRGGGTSIGPVAGFDLAVADTEWPEVDALLKLFARERGWSV